MPPPDRRAARRPAAFDPGPLAERLHEGVAALGIVLQPQSSRRLLDYLALLGRWNGVYNLTAVRDPQQMVAAHLLDCIAALPVLLEELGPREAPSILDVGSGAGLPGIVWAILLDAASRPGARVTLIDAVEKKTAFQRQACVELGLRNVQCVHGRVEHWRGGGFDLIASRAFSALSDFVGGTAHLLAPQGRWFALKGAPPHEEIAALGSDVEVERTVALIVPQLQQAARCVVVLRPQAAGQRRPAPLPVP